MWKGLPGVIMTESESGEVRYLLSDGLGSVRQAVDESGTLVAYHEFDPYGNPVQRGGAPYGFTGEWWEGDVGLLHLRARWYQPETGTFLSRDPWEGHPNHPNTLHGYSYGADNPVRFTDPSGLDYIPWLDRYTCDDPLAKSGYVSQVDQATGAWGLWPCIVDPDNVTEQGPPSLPPPPPPVTRPEESSSSDDCPIVPETGLTRCEEFTQEVQQIIGRSKTQGMTDGMTVMILAQYYSNIRIQARYLQSPNGGALLPGNPAWPTGYFRDVPIEWYRIGGSPTREDIAKYGFKKIFWNNTHHYFADFYHTYFLGDRISFFGAYGREGLQFATGENPLADTLADLKIFWVARSHALQISYYSAGLGPYTAPLIPGKIEILPGLLRTDACDSLSWSLPKGS